jgi:hypothetical protein
VSACEELAVVTVATKPDAYFNVLLQSCQRYGVKPVVLGMGSLWRGWCTKLNLVYHHVTQASSSPYVLYVDGYDSVFQAGLPEIWKSYRGFNAPIVVSACTGCWPDASIANQFPQSPTGVRFLNAGGFMGETRALVRALKIMGCPFVNENQDDQYLMARYFLTHQQEMRLDYHSEIFQTLNFRTVGPVNYRSVERVYVNHSSGKKPHVLHLDGPVSEDPSYAMNLGYIL